MSKDTDMIEIGLRTVGATGEIDHYRITIGSIWDQYRITNFNRLHWLILSLNGTHKNLYLPRCVLNVVNSDASFVRCIPKNALLPSTLENLAAPVRTCAISSRVGVLWFSRIMALFMSFGSRQIFNLLFAFLGYVYKLTHGVGSVCFGIIPCWTISPSSFSISSLYSIGTLRLLCWTGRTVGSVLMSYSPYISPM